MAFGKDIKVFISSTSEDLDTYRAAARDVILEMGWKPEMMEYMGTEIRPTVAACKEKLEQCQLMLLLVAWRRGWVPTDLQGGNGSDSITALELKHAEEQQIPVLVFLAAETWPGNLWEHEHLPWIKEFRGSINHPAGFFSWDDPGGEESRRHQEFRTKVRQAVVKHQQAIEKRSDEDWTDALEAARKGLAQGKIVPWLGSGIFGRGPLGRRSLAKELGDPADEEQQSVATAAEWREQRFPTREGFLDWFQDLIERQSAEVQRPAMYEVIAAMDNVNFIVAATWDLEFERCLLEAGRSPAIVSHIIRSADHAHDGKILVLPLDEGSDAQICLSDQLDIREWSPIVYKPLGSPLLQKYFGPDVEDLELDTVVVTETDHVELVGRLENPQTSIPTAFSRYFRRFPLLFVGYELDRWHYRLVMQVFQAVRGKRIRSLAVRSPASAIEKVAWNRLEASAIPLSPTEFAEEILKSS